MAELYAEDELYLKAQDYINDGLGRANFVKDFYYEVEDGYLTEEKLGVIYDEVESKMEVIVPRKG